MVRVSANATASVDVADRTGAVEAAQIAFVGP